MNITDLSDLNKEFEQVATNFAGYHTLMGQYQKFYKNSAFYKRKAGDQQTRAELKTNLLRVFADKNAHYTSPFPIIKVPGTPDDRQNASIREKILYGVHRKSGTPLLQKQWAKDATKKSVAIAETGFDLHHRCAYVKRHNPSRVFWQLSNDGDKRVIAFWAAFPITADEAYRRYGKTNLKEVISTATLGDPWLSPIDGKQWFTQIVRWDEKYRVAWIGDQFLEEPHEHLQGGIPIDICMPFDEDDTETQSSFGTFYLEPLVPLQAELNHTLKLRANIVARMANPLVWGRGIMAKQFDDIKSNMAKAGGGFVGLKDRGELGILQLNDVKLLNEHKDDILKDMLWHSGFSAASFGEAVGANTSGDALGLYFTPTQKLIDDENIAWIAFYESINTKILRAYDKFGRPDEKFNLDGFSSAGTVLPMIDSPGRYSYQSGSFSIEFDRSVINGNYMNIVIPQPVTPKNEIDEKRLWLDAAKQGVVSRTTAYEHLDIQSPEDEFALLREEQSEPVINPDGTQKILDAAANLPGAGAPAQLPAATPQPVSYAKP